MFVEMGAAVNKKKKGANGGSARGRERKEVDYKKRTLAIRDGEEQCNAE